MIITIKIELESGGIRSIFSECVRIIEIQANANLEDLHLAIQNAIDFENDHLYEFFISNTSRSREKLRFDDENNGIWSQTLEDIFPLKKGKSFFICSTMGIVGTLK